MSQSLRPWRLLSKVFGLDGADEKPTRRDHRTPRFESLESRAMMAADLVVDNGESAYAETQGVWADSSLAGVDGDSRYSASTNAAASFHFAGDAGSKEVFVNTPAHANSTTAARYDIVVNGNSIGNVIIDQRPGTNGWMSLGIFDISATTFEVVVSQAGTGVVRTDAVRAVDVTESIKQVTVDDLFSTYHETAGAWQYSSLGGVSGTSRYSQTSGAAASFEFTGLNDGWYEVLVNTPGHSNSTTAARYTVQNGDQTLGNVTLDQRSGTSGWQSIGLYQVEADTVFVSVAQTGSDVLRADAVRLVSRPNPVFAPKNLVDNGDLFYSEVGEWQDSALTGFDVDSRYSAAANAKATFSFFNLTPGNIEIGVNTPGHPNSTDAAVYTISSAGTVIGTVTLDQRSGSNGWLSLGTFAITGTSVEVTVANGGTGILRADSVRANPINSNSGPATSGLPSLALQEDAAPQYISLFDYFSDLEDADSALSFSLVTNTNPVLFASASILPEAGQLRLQLAPNANGQAQITIRTTDTGGLYVESILVVQVTAVDDPPDLVVPASQSAIENTIKAITGIEISDPDGSNDRFEVTLSVSHGTLSMGITSGLNFMAGDGNADAILSFQGTRSNINAALAQLTYRGNQGFSGQDSISLQASDLGAEGYGGGLSESESIAIAVEANDPPTIEALTIQSVNQRMVTITGRVQDEQSSALTVVFSGVAAGSTVTLSDGTFSITLEASQLGQISATVMDSGGEHSTPVAVQVTSQTPQIASFAYELQQDGSYRFSGSVLDETAAGLVITFGGLLAGETVIVEQGGTFSIEKRLAPGTSGNVTAQTTDWWGLGSNVATEVIV